jgi:hypothetical protein
MSNRRDLISVTSTELKAFCRASVRTLVIAFRKLDACPKPNTVHLIPEAKQMKFQPQSRARNSMSLLFRLLRRRHPAEYRRPWKRSAAGRSSLSIKKMQPFSIPASTVGSFVSLN